MKEKQRLMTDQALPASVMSWIQAPGKQKTLDVIRSGQQMDVSIPCIRESSVPVTHRFLSVALVMSS